jgi:uncharacterized RDD family membrane protein YckC
MPPNAATPSGPSGPRAGFGPHLGALVIDVLIMLVPSEAIFLALGPVSSLIWVPLFIAYCTFFVASGSGQTPGMRVMGVRVIDARTGGRVRTTNALVRCFMSIVSWLVVYVGFLWMLWDPEKQTWHDKVAHTYVVPTSIYSVERWPG